MSKNVIAQGSQTEIVFVEEALENVTRHQERYTSFAMVLTVSTLRGQRNSIQTFPATGKKTQRFED